MYPSGGGGAGLAQPAAGPSLTSDQVCRCRDRCAATGHHDVTDVHVALCARERGHAVVTSDLDDLARVDPSLVIIRV
jgi:hypothetical protein